MASYKGEKPCKPLTAHQRGVYSLLLQVPPGRVTTYQSLATQLSSSSRAVGSALHHNPYAPQVPCHRVVRTDGTIGGFAGFVSGPTIDRKIALLRGEGVLLAGDGSLLDRSQLFLFEKVEKKKMMSHQEELKITKKRDAVAVTNTSGEGDDGVVKKKKKQTKNDT